MELTTQSVCCAIKRHLVSGEVLVCGGGAHNGALLRSLQKQLPAFVVRTTADYGVDPDSLEAVAFAWFASQTLAGQPIDFTPFTGASNAVVAGGIYRP
jgi:anhydro-N-acetylmuramic acid kinase